MSEIIGGIVAFFMDLPVGAKVLWCAMGIVFVVSVLRALFSRAGSGIGAGVVVGIAVYTLVSGSRWLNGLKYVEPGLLIPIGIVAVFAIIFLFGSMVAVSEGLLSRKGLRFVGILLRIIGVAGIAALAFSLIMSIGNGGVIVF